MTLGVQQNYFFLHFSHIYFTRYEFLKIKHSSVHITKMSSAILNRKKGCARVSPASSLLHAVSCQLAGSAPFMVAMRRGARSTGRRPTAMTGAARDSGSGRVPLRRLHAWCTENGEGWS